MEKRMHDFEKIGFAFKDVFEFQEKYPDREEREKLLLTMDSLEIQHLA